MRTVEIDASVRLGVTCHMSQAAHDVLSHMAQSCDTSSLQSVASHFDMHPNTVGRLVRDACDLTFGEALLEMRMQRAWALAREGIEAGVAAPHCGYERTARFREAFRRRWDIAFEQVVCKESYDAGSMGGIAGCGCDSHGASTGGPGCDGNAGSGQARRKTAMGEPDRLQLTCLRGHSGRELVLAATVRLTVPDPHDALASSMLDYVAEHCEDVTLQSLAGQFGVHPNTASAIVRRAAGKTFSQLLLETRMARAGEMLAGAGVSVAQIARACGYENLASFYRAFHAAYGHAPGVHRASAA